MSASANQVVHNVPIRLTSASFSSRYPGAKACSLNSAGTSGSLNVSSWPQSSLPQSGMNSHAQRRDAAAETVVVEKERGDGCSSVEEKNVLKAVPPVCFEKLLSCLDVLLFDCDGVLWHGNDLVDGAHEALRELRRRGKKMYFITNNSSKSREGYLQKFRRLGLDDVVTDASQIVCTAHVAAAYLTEQGFAKKVYVIGEAGIEEELTAAGIEWLGGSRDSDKVVNEDGMIIDSDVGCVLVGLDRRFNYYKLQYAQRCINELKAMFIATNTDSLGHFTPHEACAGSGGMVAAVQACTSVSPIVMGKPETIMIDILRSRMIGPPSASSLSKGNTKAELDDHLSSSLLSTERCDSAAAACTTADATITSSSFDSAGSTRRFAMIGDRLDTDILFGRNAGLTTILVLSGITQLQHVEKLTRQHLAKVRDERALNKLPHNGSTDNGSTDTAMATSVSPFAASEPHEEPHENIFDKEPLSSRERLLLPDYYTDSIGSFFSKLA